MNKKTAVIAALVSTFIVGCGGTSGSAGRIVGLTAQPGLKLKSSVYYTNPTGPVTVIQSFADGSYAFAVRGEVTFVKAGRANTFSLPLNQDGIPAGTRLVVFDPSFQYNGRVFAWNGHFTTRGGTPEFSVLPMTFKGNGWAPGHAIYTTGAVNAYGMVIGVDNKLYLSGNDPLASPTFAQDLHSTIGKVIRLNLDGSVPTANPFSSHPDSSKFNLTVGNGRVDAITWNAVLGGALSLETTSPTSQELNFLVAGHEYGFPTPNETSSCPLLSWSDGSKGVAMMTYTGSAIIEWKGDVLIAWQQAGSTRSFIRRVHITQGQVTADQTVDLGTEGLVTAICQAPDGAILYATAGATNRTIWHLAKG